MSFLIDQKKLTRILSTQTTAPTLTSNTSSNTTSQTSYPFTRFNSEADRLDAQHDFVRTWCRGALLHSSIPRGSIQRVADIGCGTGIWMRDMKESTLPDAEFVGFDIDDAQFPVEARRGEEKRDEGIRHVVHDVTKRFPREHRDSDGEGFDLVHVRFMSFALRKWDVDNVVRNLYEILKPGGYLQWQEFHNLLFFPETRTVTSLKRWFLRERLELGLASAVTPLLLRILATLKLEQGLRTTSADKPSLQDASSNDEYAFNILQMQTIPTWDHPDLQFGGQVQTWMNDAGMAALLAMLARRQRILKSGENNRKSEEQLSADIRELEGFANMYKEGGELQRAEKHALLNWMVARKAMKVPRDQSWMQKTCSHDKFRERNML
ncbi:S-adenosyl-L-methionine-dependent methyltransferase [Viridothelium virens]|uniref:S-adenosyl-L-methionine-dependent methyltransferase n=1 Tax=Viridothelium virens TaxID=1048519 RepID=A0A6A6H0U9_VIRVR|nr:S-adenosyl-L-methionine-dependent methyltransferase [Viridothelium virens]